MDVCSKKSERRKTKSGEKIINGVKIINVINPFWDRIVISDRDRKKRDGK